MYIKIAKLIRLENEKQKAGSNTSLYYMLYKLISNIASS
jgi:hypothetical protein